MRHVLLCSYIPLHSVALHEVEVKAYGTSGPQIEDRIPWSIVLPLTQPEWWDLSKTMFLTHTNSFTARALFLEHIVP